MTRKTLLGLLVLGLVVVGCAQRAVRTSGQQKPLVESPAWDDPDDELVAGRPRRLAATDGAMPQEVYQLSRSTPMSHTSYPINTDADALRALSEVRPDRTYSYYAEAGGYFIFADSQRGSPQPSPDLFYGIAFRKGGTEVYSWATPPVDYLRHIEAGATVVDDIVCILDLVEWNPDQRHYVGRTKSLNEMTIKAGSFFRIDARIVNVMFNQPHAGLSSWFAHGFLPSIKLSRLDDGETEVRHGLVPTSSRDNPSEWWNGKALGIYDVPESAFGDYRAMLRGLPPGRYKLVVSIQSDAGELRSNPQTFTIEANED